MLPPDRLAQIMRLSMRRHGGTLIPLGPFPTGVPATHIQLQTVARIRHAVTQRYRRPGAAAGSSDKTVLAFGISPQALVLPSTCDHLALGLAPLERAKQKVKLKFQPTRLTFPL